MSLVVLRRVRASEVELDDRNVAVNDAMRASANFVRDSISALLRVGARNAGILIQSGLLRASHSSRASGLFALSNSMLRIVESVCSVFDNNRTKQIRSL